MGSSRNAQHRPGADEGPDGQEPGAAAFGESILLGRINMTSPNIRRPQ